ncbi:prephenate dehydrogenase [Methanobrevibacter sp.]|uniref:prephenate dehydrogenase n=1 Tax=Methanobrevibacter sp. TaxID=66852 RepID=UPI0025FD813A|nr:prephenate dehydrogenase [Methanobrevibacter sp.]MBQ2962806.1 prephenate dehydrogenase [Methanobrevibacter sp.]
MKKIGIIGGTRGLGRTLAWYFKDFNFDVTVTGRDEIVGAQVSEDLGIKYSNNNRKIAQNSDMVIIAVPISSTESVIEELAPFMKEGSVMIDVTSVKEGPSYKMKECLNGRVEFIPTHPVFGPRTTDLKGQIIVLTPLEKGKWYPKVYRFLEDLGMRIVETTPEHHDDMMGVVQVLTHFSYISTASAIEKLQVDIKDTENYESPIYNLMIDTIARIVSQNPHLTYSIQHENKRGEKIRQALFDSISELKETLTKEDEDEFVEIALRATKHMGDIQAALGRSDKAITALTQEYNVLLQSIGEEVGLKHIYSDTIHVGTVKEIDLDYLYLEDENNKVKKLRISNVKVLNEGELHQWKINNQKIYTRDISAVFNRKSSPHIIKDTLNRVEDIIGVEIIDIYKGEPIKENQISYTFKILSLTEDAIEECIKILTGFGGITR